MRLIFFLEISVYPQCLSRVICRCGLECAVVVVRIWNKGIKLATGSNSKRSFIIDNDTDYAIAHKVRLMLHKVAWADSLVITITTQKSAHGTLRSIKRTLIAHTFSHRIGVKLPHNNSLENKYSLLRSTYKNFANQDLYLKCWPPNNAWTFYNNSL